MKTTIGTLAWAATAFLLMTPVHAEDMSMERDYEIALAKGQYQIELENYGAAISHLEQALELKPGDQAARVSLGIALSRAGEHARAREVLRQAADADPADGRARYELAQVLAKLGDRSRAEGLMEQALELSRDEDLSEAARGFLREAGGEGEEGPGLRLSAGTQYDSNVILEQDDPIAPSPDGKSDWRGVIVADGALPFLTAGKRGGEAGYRFYQSLHRELEDYNVQQHTLRLAGHAAFSRTARFDLGYVYVHSFVGGEKYSTVHGVVPRMTFRMSSRSMTEVSGGYESRKFFDTPVFANLTEKSGDNVAISAVHTMRAGKNTVLSLAYAFDQDSTRQAYWDYTGHRVRATLMAEAGAYRVFAGVSYYDRKYGGASPGAAEKRHDGAQEALVGLSRKAGKRLTVSLSDTYTFNDSNLARYEYRRNIAGLFVEMTL